MAILLFNDIRIAATQNSAALQVPVPPGNWRVVSFIAYAIVANNVETTDVETTLAVNEVERLRASESGSLQAFIAGPVTLTITAIKKVALADVLVRVIIKLEQS